jgi:hypothetical protein
MPAGDDQVAGEFAPGGWSGADSIAEPSDGKMPAQTAIDSSIRTPEAIPGETRMMEVRNAFVGRHWQLLVVKEPTKRPSSHNIRATNCNRRVDAQFVSGRLGWAIIRRWMAWC